VTEAAGLYREIDALITALRREGDAQMAAWADCVVRAGFAESASNLASYMALRRRDLRPLHLFRAGQRALIREVKDDSPERLRQRKINKKN